MGFERDRLAVTSRPYSHVCRDKNHCSRLSIMCYSPLVHQSLFQSVGERLEKGGGDLSSLSILFQTNTDKLLPLLHGLKVTPESFMNVRKKRICDGSRKGFDPSECHEQSKNA